MFSSIIILVKYINTWDTDHAVKKIVMIHAKPLISRRLQHQYSLWLLIHISNCLAGASQTNCKLSISNFTPLSSILSFCKLLYFVKNMRTNSSTLDGFLLRWYMPEMKGDNFWKLKSIGQNWALVHFYRTTPSFFGLELLLDFHRRFFWYHLVNQGKYHHLHIFSPGWLNVEILKLPHNNSVSIHAHAFSFWLWPIAVTSFNLSLLLSISKWTSLTSLFPDEDPPKFFSDQESSEIKLLQSSAISLLIPSSSTDILLMSSIYQDYYRIWRHL